MSKEASEKERKVYVLYVPAQITVDEEGQIKLRRVYILYVASSLNEARRYRATINQSAKIVPVSTDIQIVDDEEEL